MNLNELAKEVCSIEGGKVNLPIAQVKEVMRCLFTRTSDKYTLDEVIDIMEKYATNKTASWGKPYWKRWNDLVKKIDQTNLS